MRDALSRALNLLWPSGLGLSGLGDERQSIIDLKAECDRLAARSPFHGIDHRKVVVEMAFDAAKAHGREPHQRITVAICESIDALMVAEGIIEPEIDWDLFKTSFGYQDEVRARLDSRKQFFSKYDANMEIWRRKVVAIFAGLLGYLSDFAFGDHDEGPTFEVALTDAIENLDDAIDRLLVTYDDEDFRYPNLSREVRETLIHNLLHASGIDPASRRENTKRLVIPSEANVEGPADLISKYLRNTPYELFFRATAPFSIPEKARFEHCHILGGTGHGKTQLIQHLIYADLERAQYERRSVVVIDSQGDLIRKLSRLKLFARNTERSLYSRFCIIDPSDIEYPASLNIFDISRERIAKYGKAEREKVLNGTIELYENFFGSLLGAELTQKQGVIFKYLARLMLEIPGATIHTLRDLMDDAEPFIPYMEGLKGSARYFFEREFFDRSFAPTKKQISKRLWGVLATPSFERMFAQEENKIDMFALLNRGSVILINTAKDLLKQEGCELFGRFFLSMIAQAAMERSVIDERERTPTTVYIDEAQEYFDDNIGILLAQARKYKIAICAGNQTLDQLSPGLRASFMSNVGTKIVGGLSSKDANAFAAEMHTSSEFLQSLRKRNTVSEFALHVRHHTKEAIRIEVPLGFLESNETLSADEYEELIDRSRDDYAVRVSDDEEVQKPFRRPEAVKPRKFGKEDITLRGEEEPPVEEKASEEFAPPEPSAPVRDEETPPTPPPPKPARKAKAPHEPPPMGRGGRQHRYLQELIKGLAEQEGFLSRIEEEVQDGEGFVDVSLSRGEERIACEISITTPPEKELANIRKCFAAGYGTVWVIAPEQKHLASIRSLASRELSDAEQKQVTYLRPDDIPAALLERPMPALETTVRGYRVRVTRAGASFDETQAKRATVAEVLARSVQASEGKG